MKGNKRSLSGESSRISITKFFRKTSPSESLDANHAIAQPASTEATPTHSSRSTVHDLRRIFATVGVQVDDVNADGNCMFEVLVRQLQRLDCIDQAETHSDLRRRVVQYLSENPQINGVEIGKLVEEEHKSMEIYLTKMARSGYYGDGVIIQVVEVMFGKKVKVFRYEEMLPLEPENYLKETDEQCLLMGYVNFVSDNGCASREKNHYVNIIPAPLRQERRILTQNIPEASQLCSQLPSSQQGGLFEAVSTQEDRISMENVPETSQVCVQLPSSQKLRHFAATPNANHSFVTAASMSPFESVSKPNQPRNIVFPSDKNNRRFRPLWYTDFQWLHWDQTLNDGKGAVLCNICRHGHMFDFNSVSCKEEAFTTKGYKNWKNAVKRFQGHETSEYHHSTSYKLSFATKNNSVLSQLNSKYDGECKAATQSLVTVFRSIQYLTRQGIALRNCNEDNGNLLQLLKLQCYNNPHLKVWLTKKTNWLSHEIQNEIIRMMALTILREIAVEIRSSDFLGLLADETSDASHVEQMVVCIRTVSDELIADELVLGLHSLDRCDAETLFSTITDVFQRLNIDSSKCRAMCFDGASSFQGRISGVAAKFKEIQPKAVLTHCQMHCVNLAVQDTVSNVPIMRDFLLIVTDLINFLRDSPKRLAIVRGVGESLGCSQTTVRPLCPTRFTVKMKALEGISNQVDTLQEALTQIEEESCDAKIQSHANGLKRRMEEFEFHFCLCVSLKLFDVTDRLSRQLQCKELSAGSGMQLVQFAIDELQHSRNDDMFAKVWADACARAKQANAEGPKLPRQPRAPQKFQQHTVHQFQSPVEMYRAKYFEIVDRAISCLRSRITDKATPLLIAIERLLLAGWMGDKVKADDLMTVKDACTTDIDITKLPHQLESLVHVRSQSQCSVIDQTITNAQEIIHSIGKTPVKVMVPDVVKLCKIYLVNPATTATAERTFSLLRRLKNYLRTTMTQQRLNHCLILNLYQDRIDSLDINSLVNEFICNADSKRRNTFALL